MKEYDKYIFDLDYTLLIPDWSLENEFLKANLNIDNIDDFLEKKDMIVNKFQDESERYDISILSSYFKSFGFDVDEKLINKWLVHNGHNIIDTLPKGVKELLSFLKSKNKTIIVLTNWFGATQEIRLKKNGLYKYIDKMIAGEKVMKPNKKAFLLAIGDTPKEKCIMIGDNPIIDIKGAKNVGIDAYQIEDETSIYKFYQEVKKTLK